MTKPFTTLTAFSVALGVCLVSSPALAGKSDEARNLGAFTKVAANGSSDVVITVGKKQSVTVRAEEGEHVEIMTEVKNGELTIWRENKKGGWRNHSADVIITMPELEKLANRGSGDAVATGIKTDEFVLVQQGSGDVEIDGSCKSAKITSQGSGDLESAKLSCDDVKIKLQGSGDMTVSKFKTQTVELRADGSGDVDFEGSCDTFDLGHRASGDVDAHTFKCKVVHVKAQGSGDMRVFATNDTTVNIRGSGDVEVYGGASISNMETSGSGSVRTR